MPKQPPSAPRTDVSLADAKDLKDLIVQSVEAHPIAKRTLRAAVWSYVGNERRAGSSPSQIIAELTAMIDASELRPLAARQAVTKQTILWCVEEYFGHLGGDPLRDAARNSDNEARG